MVGLGKSRPHSYCSCNLKISEILHKIRQNLFSVLMVLMALLLCLILPIWDGYKYTLLWILLQLPLIIIFRLVYFSHADRDVSYWLDVILVSFLIILVSMLSAFLVSFMIRDNVESKIYISDNVYTPDEVAMIIQTAEVFAAFRNGWGTKRHRYYPTTDLAVYSINETVVVNNCEVLFPAWVNRTVRDRILPRLANLYNIDVKLMSMKDLFIVKYNAENPLSQRRLSLHQDSSLLSFNVALSQFCTFNCRNSTNNKSSFLHQKNNISRSAVIDSRYLYSKPSYHFIGGGTYIAILNKTLQINSGSLLMHPSQLFHAGTEITAGQRYILVGFVNVNIYSASTIWRHWGSLSRCIHVTQADNVTNVKMHGIEQNTGRLQRHTIPNAIPGIAENNVLPGQSLSHCISWYAVMRDSVTRTYDQIFSDPNKSQRLLRLLIISLSVVVCLGCLCCGCYGCMLFAEWYLDSGTEVEGTMIVRNAAIKVL